MAEKIVIGEGDFKAEFKIFIQESNSWETLAVVYYENLVELLDVMTAAVRVATASVLSQLEKH